MTLTAERPRTRRAKEPLRCARCGIHPRRTNPDGSLAYICLACSGEVQVTGEVRRIEEAAPGNVWGQRAAALRMGWYGKWTARA